nr:hypothetical protein [Tanacetum cinerariifolium]
EVHTPRSDEERFKQYELTGNVQQQYNDPPLSKGHTVGSGEDGIQLIKELMETCTKLSERVLALKESKTAHDLGKVTPTQVSAQGEAHSQEYQLEDQLGVLSAAKVLADAARKMFRLILEEEG